MYPNERGIRNPNAPAAASAGATQQQPYTYGQSAASGPAPTTAGHHRHDILNKLDPRVDSTRDHQPVSQTGSDIPEGTYGPHRSRLANALDPRVDSDLDSTRAGAGMGAGGGLGGGQPTGVMGAGGGSGVAEGTYGPHATRAGNMLDPRVDSDRDRHVGRGAVSGVGGGAPHGVGVGGAGAGVSAPHTAGPHRSDLMNKLDPRVDSKTGAYKAGVGTRGPTS
ncbi:hypothetical protein C8A03DRAFT_46104 [Achaetomium macrosporum]|uniref:Uncharacterized protein n=1 Tax=Achaetomium macrosporum TaxID=79813 RepID=A0AAN7C6F4_9PEZI|nr:hypothetical protein C8A03DRAFT_46104 [Achaetomium macrosporum]